MFFSRIILPVFILLTGMTEGALAHQPAIRKRSYLVTRGNAGSTSKAVSIIISSQLTD